MSLADILIMNALCPQVSLNCVRATQDFSGVHYTFGLPGLLGVMAYIVLLLISSPLRWVPWLTCSTALSSAVGSVPRALWSGGAFRARHLVGLRN